ncbi:MAG TPA: PBP1A family penicillin-binding protein [Vicinamibacteria bacterium]|nr:PBP1A family penicillin-binding protein [Vicinamibacteria bacterium]
MAHPGRRVAPTGSRGNTYSPQRLRLVLILLTALTLPVVIGCSVVIYYYLKFNVMVDRRLHGERWQVPARLYARPLVLRPGLPMTVRSLVDVLNGLKYEEKDDVPAAPGQFAVDERTVTFTPRGQEPSEPVLVTVDKERIKELRGLTTKRVYATLTLEPQLITYLFDESREKQRTVHYEEYPDHLIKAVLAIEDRRFFSHPGLDPFRIVGAAVRNIEAESYIQGGSTITQQLVKNFFLTPEKSFRRKAQEALIAFVLERRANKKDILELYLNEVYLGQVGSFSITGLGEAARMYFHKDVGNLTLAESALLAGMIQSPNPYNPYRHPKRATDRRNLVLRAMVEARFVDAATAEAAIAQPVRVESTSLDSSDAPYFVDLVKQQLSERYDTGDLATQNLSVHTSLDLPLQALAQEVLREGLEKADKMVRRKDHPPAQGALIALEPSTGAVVALVGGRDYGTSQYNRATTARRQPGSTFKPFVYLAAFEATFDDPALPPITPATVVEDAPSVFLFGRQEYAPQNYENDYRGFVTLRYALAHSLNNATVKVAEMVGYYRIADLWNRRFGMPSKVQPYPAMSLGSFEATPLELAAAYNILANMGLKVPPATVLRVVDEKGTTIEQHYPSPPRVARPESTFLVVNMMRSVINNGTAAAARSMGFTSDAAGKTGTTNDLRDAWFGGFTPDLLCVVWVGFDDNTPTGLSGSRAALPIWVEFMKRAQAGARGEKFPVPSSNVVFIQIDRQTGLLATPDCPQVISESFVAGTEPREYCGLHAPYRQLTPTWGHPPPSPAPSPWR